VDSASALIKPEENVSSQKNGQINKRILQHAGRQTPQLRKTPHIQAVTKKQRTQDLSFRCYAACHLNQLRNKLEAMGASNAPELGEHYVSTTRGK
jgi:hypothetical protein